MTSWTDLGCRVRVRLLGCRPVAVARRCAGTSRHLAARARASMIHVSDRPELPAESVLGGLQPSPWDGAVAVQYEVAIEMLSQQIAECTDQITTEQARATPDAARLRRLNSLIDSLTRTRQELRSDDVDQVQSILRTARQRVDEIRAL